MTNRVIVGTANFRSVFDVFRMYGDFEYAKAALDEGRAIVGEPTDMKEGDKLLVNAEGRFFVETDC